MAFQNDSRERVVVTGIGVISSVGTGIENFWKGLLEGKCGVGRLTRFDSEGYTCKVASEVNDFDPTDYIDPKEVKRNDRYTHFAIAAAQLAVKDAKLDPKKVEDPTRFGVIIGSGIGGMDTIEKQSRKLFEGGPRKVSPFMIPSLIANMAAGVVALEVGARGANFAVVSACATGTHAIGEAMELIRTKKADVMIAGGSEAAITELGFAGFCSMRAMSTNFNDTPEKSSRPFDANRDGFVMGEGAGILILENYEHAKARGAEIYCELVGYGATCDAYHITSPDPEGKGLSKCILNTLEDGGIKPEDVDYINAHGTSTPYNDKFETLAIKSVFGERAKDLLISSTKSMTGHLLGAAGGVEAAAAIMAIKTGEVPPTINYENPDPDCDLNYVPNKKVSAKVDVALSENLGFGGQNAALVFKRLED